MVERSNIHENHQNDLGSNPAFMLGAAGLESASLWEYLSNLALNHFAIWAKCYLQKNIDDVILCRKMSCRKKYYVFLTGKSKSLPLSSQEGSHVNLQEKQLA